MAMNKKSSPNIRKSTPANQWFKNAARSMGLAATEIITDITPATGEFLVNNAGFGKEVISNVKDARRNAKPLSAILNVGPQVTIAKKALKNAKDDLKTGNFWNTERQQAAIESGDDMDLGDDFAFLDLNDADYTVDSEETDESGNTTKVIHKNTQVNVVSSTKPVVSALKGNASVTLNAAEAVISTNKHLAERNIAITQQTGLATLKGLETMNDNLSLLVNFQNDSMTKYIAASIKYYDESLTEIKNTVSALNRAYPATPEGKAKAADPDVFGVYGGFDLRNYGKMVKNNLANMDNMAASMIRMIFENTDTLEHLAQAPLKALVKGGAKAFLRGGTRKALGQMDESFGAFGPALMMRFNRLRESDNPFMQMLGEAFGMKTKSKQSIDTTKYNRGPLPWDGQSKRALEEIIPSHLSAIRSAITGQTEKMFDYEKGVWSSVEEMQKNYDQKLREVSNSGYSDLTSEIRNMMQAMEFGDKKELEKFNLGMEKFFQSLTKKDHQVNPNKKDELAAVYDFGGNPAMQDLFQSLILNSSKGSQMNAFGAGQMQSRKAMKSLMEDLEANPSKYNAGLLNSKGNYNEGFEAGKDGKLVAKKGFGVGARVDAFGNDDLHYLRGILHTLQEGITVCSDCDNGSTRKYRSSNKAKEKYTERFRNTLEAERAYEKANAPKVKAQKDTTPEDIDRMSSNGTTYFDSISSMGGNPSAMIKHAMDNRESNKGSNTPGEDTIVGKIGRSLSGNTQQNYYSMVEKIDDLTNRPAKLLESTFAKIDNTLYNIVFGIKNDGKGTFMDSVINKMSIMFEDVGDFAKEKIFSPMMEFFLGENGIWKKTKENPMVKVMTDMSKKFLLGETDGSGKRVGGMFSGVLNSVTDAAKYMAYSFSGKSYTDSKGITRSDNEDSVFGIISKAAKTTMTETKNYVLGDKNAKDVDKQKGSITFITDAVKDSVSDWREAMFGPADGNKLRAEGSKSMKEMGEKVGRGFPKAVVGALGAGAVGAGLSQLGAVGLVGSAILPGGPVGMALLGAGLGMATESTRFMEWAFGPQNDNGKRAGGAILSAQRQEFLRRNKGVMIGGAAVGAASNLLGFGILPGIIGPAGPLGAAVIGAATGMVLRSDKMQEFLFGPKNLDGKRVGGLVQKAFGKFNKGLKDDAEKGNKGLGRKLANIGVGAAGGAGIGTLIGATGLLGSFFSPMAPIGLAVAGAAAGISLTSERWKKYVFGEWDDKEGVKKGGIAQKFTNWSRDHIFDPMKFTVQDTISDMKFWFKDTVVEGLKFGLSPIKDAAVFAGKDLKEGFKYVGGFFNTYIGKPVKEEVIMPIGAALSATLVTPAKAIMKGVYNVQKGLFKTLAGIPFKLIEGIGAVAGAGLAARGVVKGSYNSLKDRAYENMANPDASAMSQAKNLLGTFSPSNLKAMAFGDDGAKGLMERYVNLKANRQTAKDERNREKAELRQQREIYRTNRKIGWATGYSDYYEDGTKINYLGNVAKSNSAFDKYVRKGVEGGSKFNDRLSTTLGVTANQLLELRDDRDITQITKGQRKDLAKKIQKAKKLGLKGDELLQALGVEKVNKPIEQKAQEASVQVAETMELVKDNMFDINNSSHQKTLADVITSAINNATGKIIPDDNTPSGGPTVGNSGNIPDLKEMLNQSSDSIDLTEVAPGSTKREKLPFMQMLWANMKNPNMGIVAGGNRILYKDQLNPTAGPIVNDQDILRQGFKAKEDAYNKKNGITSDTDWVKELANSKKPIPVELVGGLPLGGGSSDDDGDSDGFGGIGKLVRADKRNNKRGTSTMGLGTLVGKLIGGVGSAGRGVAKGVSSLVGLLGGGGGKAVSSIASGGKAVSSVGGKTSSGLTSSLKGGSLSKGKTTGISMGSSLSGAGNMILDFMNAMSTVGRRVGSSLNASYSTNNASRILGGGGSSSTTANASENFEYQNNGTAEVSQRQSYARRRNVNDFLSRKGQEAASMMDARFKHGNIDLLSQISANTRMTAELLGNQFDLDHGFYTWLRNFLENRLCQLLRDCKDCDGGTGFTPPGTTPKDPTPPDTTPTPVPPTGTTPPVEPTGEQPVENPVETPSAKPVYPEYLVDDNIKSTPFDLPTIIPIPMKVPSKKPGSKPIELPNKKPETKPTTKPATKPVTPETKPFKPTVVPDPEKKPTTKPSTPETKPFKPTIVPDPEKKPDTKPTTPKKDPKVVPFEPKKPDTKPSTPDKKPDVAKLDDYREKKNSKKGAAKLWDTATGYLKNEAGHINLGADVGKDKKPKVDLTKAADKAKDIGKTALSGRNSVLKSGLKSVGKIAGGVATGGLLTAALTATDFVAGKNDAASILKKDQSKVTKHDKLGAGVANAAVNLIPFGGAMDDKFFDGKVTEAVAKVTAKGSEVVAKAGEGLKTMGDKVSDIWKGTGDKVGEAKETIVSGASEKWSSIKEKAGSAWDKTKEILGLKSDEINNDTDTKLGEGKTTMASKWDKFKSILGLKSDEINTDSETKLGEGKTTMSGKWDKFKSILGLKSDEINKDSESKLGQSKTTMSGKWDKFKSIVGLKSDEINKTTETKLGAGATEAGSKLSTFASKVGTKAKEIGEAIKSKLEAGSTSAGSLLGGFASEVASIGKKIGNAIKKGLNALTGGGQGIDNYLTTESDSLMKKIDSLKDNTASIKEKKSDFGKGGPTIASLDSQFKNGVLPSDSDIEGAIGGIFGQGCNDPNCKVHGKGDDKYYAQTDSRWANKKLLGRATMGTSGCGPTAASMVVSSLTGKNVLPTEAAKFAVQNDLVDERKGVSSELFSSFGKENGVDVNPIMPSNDKILESLAKGNKVILRGENSKDYTDEGHFIVASGLTKDGKVKINDPLSRSRSGVKDINDIKGTTNAFVASANGNGLSSNDKIKKAIAYAKGTDNIFSNPLPKGKMTSPFGYRDIGAGREFHYGIDLSTGKNDPIQAAADGEVYNVIKNHNSYGNVVFIKHDINGKRMDTVYAHLKSISVSKGTKVKRGQTIGLEGTTGRSTGIHLHFEIHDGAYNFGKTNVDPAPYIFKGAVPTPNPFGGDGSSSDSSSSSTATREAEKLKQKFNELFKTPDYVNQMDHAFSVAIDNLIYGTKDDIGRYDENSSSSSSSSSSSDGSLPTLKGSNNAEKVWNFFKTKGFVSPAIAGVLGNLHQESGVDPTKKQTNGTAKGLAQWEGARWTKLKNKAKSKGVSEWGLDIQLQHLWDELNGEDPTTKSILNKQYGGLEGLSKMNDYKQATIAFEKSFERAGKPMYEKRYKYAADYLNLYSTSGKGMGVGGPAMVLPDVTPEDISKNIAIPFGVGEGVVSSLDSRYNTGGFEQGFSEVTKEPENTVIEKEVHHYGKGTGLESDLSSQDIKDILKYLSVIADNTKDINTNITNYKSGDVNIIPANAPAQQAKPLHKGSNQNNVDQRAYNRAASVTRGRRK